MNDLDSVRKEKKGTQQHAEMRDPQFVRPPSGSRLEIEKRKKSTASTSSSDVVVLLSPAVFFSKKEKKENKNKSAAAAAVVYDGRKGFPATQRQRTKKKVIGCVTRSPPLFTMPSRNILRQQQAE